MKRIKRILVVDDNAASCQAAAAILRELGCAVETMADASTALERLRHVVPDALLVDLNIPDMAAVDAIRVGARACIRKPIDTGSLVVALQPLLGVLPHSSVSPPLSTATECSPSVTNRVNPTH